jgi:hypothetical protein
MGGNGNVQVARPEMKGKSKLVPGENAGPKSDILLIPEF